MQIIDSITEIKKLRLPLALALGNFDGVHLGHQALLDKCVAKSREKGWIPSALLWDPHPAQVVQRKKQQFKFLNTLEQRYQLLKSSGINYVFCLPFDLRVASLSPQDFVQEYLVNLMKIKAAFVGFNYSFGQKGSGGSELLKEIGDQKGFEVCIIEPIYLEGQIVSSTLIRQKYEAGDMLGAAKYLGYYPTIEGPVVTGQSRGREMGYPTANIEVSPFQALPSFGVYVTMTEYDGKQYPSIVNIGERPTFNSKNVTVEVFIFNFNQKIYQQKLKISLLEKIRSEEKFKSKEALQAQIDLDIKAAFEIFKKDNFNLC